MQSLGQMLYKPLTYIVTDSNFSDLLPADTNKQPTPEHRGSKIKI